MLNKQDRTEYRRFYRLAFPGIVRGQERATRARWGKNAEKCKAYRLRNLSQARAKDRARYPQRLKSGYFRGANQRSYRRNPVAALVRWAKREAMKHAARQGDPKLITAIFARAAELRQWFDVVVDHIIPLSRGGAHSAENLQIIYRSENFYKGVRLDYQLRIIFT